MFGKVIRLNDFKFTFGQETVYLNVFAVFKNKKSGNKYIIYSYDNKKLYSGSAFIKNNEIVVMISKSEEDDVIKDFTNKLANEEDDDNYEIISLDKVTSIQIIDEKLCNKSIDIFSNYILYNICKIKTYKNLSEEEINTLKNIISKENIYNND